MPFAALYLSDIITSKLRYLFYKLLTSTVATVDENDIYTRPRISNAPKPVTDARRLHLYLGGTINIPPNHPAAPQTLEVIINLAMGFKGTRSTGFEWPIEQAFHAREAIRTSVPRDFGETFQKRGWGDPVLDSIVIPLSSEGDLAPLGVVILGLNTRRNFDADYSTWIDVLRSAMSSYLTGAVAREEEVKRSEYVPCHLVGLLAHFNLSVI